MKQFTQDELRKELRTEVKWNVNRESPEEKVRDFVTWSKACKKDVEHQVSYMHETTFFLASSPGSPLLGTKERAKTEGSLVEFKSHASTSVTLMTSNVTRLSVVSRTRLLAAVANALAEFLPPLKLLKRFDLGPTTIKRGNV